jgi:hypothetical protein
MSLLLPHKILKPPDLFKAFNHYKLLKKLLKSSAAATAAGSKMQSSTHTPACSQLYLNLVC